MKTQSIKILQNETLFNLMILCFSFSFAKKQTERYIEHPAMEVVEKFINAICRRFRDVKKLGAENFTWKTQLRTEPGTLQQLLQDQIT